MNDRKAPEPTGAPRAAFPDRRQWERTPLADPVASGAPVRLPEPGAWSDEITRWLEERQREHPENPDRKRRRPRAYLDIAATFARQISAFQVGEPGTVTVSVWNAGNVPAWSCHVELYELPAGFTTPLADGLVRGREILSLHPGDRRDITLSWLRTGRTGRIAAIVFDPILDPKGFTVVPQTDRHLTSASYVDLD